MKHDGEKDVASMYENDGNGQEHVTVVEIIFLAVPDKIPNNVTTLSVILYLYRTICIWPDLQYAKSLCF